MTHTVSFEEMAHQPDQLRSQLDDVTARLVDDYRNIPATVVRSCVRSESGRFAGARVYAYIPVLVERAARSRLNRRRRHRQIADRSPSTTARGSRSSAGSCLSAADGAEQEHIADSPGTLCSAATVADTTGLSHDQDNA
jgi:hypothetical protein